MKRIYLALMSILLMGTLWMGCEENFLDVTDPNRLTPQNFYSSEDKALQVLISAYANLQYPLWGRWGHYEVEMVVENYKSDEVKIRHDVPEWTQIATFTNDANNYSSNNYWFYNYSGIFRCNQLLEALPGIDNMSEETKKVMAAEAKFLRALYYFRQVTYFGNVPLILETPKTPDDYYQPQANPQDVWNQIEKDLTEARQDLPKTWDAQYKGRATWGAATALLGKVYMFQKRYDEAIILFEEIINSGLYKLVPVYYELFTGLNENSEEVIFELQFDWQRPNDVTESTITPYELWDQGYIECYPSDWLVSLYLKDTTATGEFSQRAWGSIAFGTNDIYSLPHPFTAADTNQTAYWKKYVYTDPSWDTPTHRSPINFPIIRYAEVLLLYAEALVEVNRVGDAIDAVNQVRARAGSVLLPSSLTAEQVRNHIRHVEKPLELAFEGVRWLDLVRWGNVKATLEAHGKVGVENFIEGVHELYPIPNSELERNPYAVQNPGY